MVTTLWVSTSMMVTCPVSAANANDFPSGLYVIMTGQNMVQSTALNLRI